MRERIGYAVDHNKVVLGALVAPAAVYDNVRQDISHCLLAFSLRVVPPVLDECWDDDHTKVVNLLEISILFDWKQINPADELDEGIGIKAVLGPLQEQWYMFEPLLHSIDHQFWGSLPIGVLDLLGEHAELLGGVGELPLDAVGKLVVAAIEDVAQQEQEHPQAFGVVEQLGGRVDDQLERVEVLQHAVDHRLLQQVLVRLLLVTQHVLQHVQPVPFRPVLLHVHQQVRNPGLQLQAAQL
jgi:hypothetical protein